MSNIIDITPASGFPYGYVSAQADLYGKAFVYAGREGLDSDDFAKKILTHPYGIRVITDHDMIQYSGSTYLYNGLKLKIKFKRGNTYSEDILYFTGFLYKYWVSVVGENPVKVYKLAPIAKIAKRFNRYHTEGWSYVIGDLSTR